jgi:hypothetical protein
MKQLHKTMIKELTHGGYDPHIAAFFTSRGEPARLDAPAPAPDIVEAIVAEAQPELPPAPFAPAVRLALAAPIAVVEMQVPPSDVTPAGLAPSEPRTGTPAPAVVRRPVPPRPKPVVVVRPTALKRPPVVLSSSADGVVVRRNVVINVGGGAPPVNGSAPPAAVAEPARQRLGARIAMREGSYGTGSPSSSRVPTKQELPPQPLAASHGLQMPWEIPGEPSTTSPPVLAAVAEPAPRGSRQIRMPWDPPGSAAAKDAFSGELVNDKSLDEVILEYLSDDAEPEENH